MCLIYRGVFICAKENEPRSSLTNGIFIGQLEHWCVMHTPSFECARLFSKADIMVRLASPAVIRPSCVMNSLEGESGASGNTNQMPLPEPPAATLFTKEFLGFVIQKPDGRLKQCMFGHVACSMCNY